MTDQSIRVRFITSYSGAGTKEFKRDVDGMGTSIRRVTQNAGQSFTKFGRFAQAAGTALMVGVGGALAVGIKAAIDFEDAFAGVRKTVDASEDTFQRLARDIREMALEIPIAATELARIGELGGQLGIPVDALDEFIEVIAKLGVTTNLQTEEAATSLARFANVMGSAPDEFENIGSALVELGNNAATSEKEIVNFATRLAGIGATIGLTEGEVLGLAAGFSELGEPAERGATAVQRAFVSMFQAVSTGNEDLKTFADTVGITVEEFITLFNEDPAQAFIAFAEGLNQIIESGGDVTTLLQDLGLGSQRTLGAMLKAASGFDVLAENVDRGNDSFRDATALNEEAEKRFGTMASQIQILKNKFTDLRIEIGDKATPAFRDVLSFAGGFFDVVKDNIGALQGLAAIVGVLAGARGLLKLGQSIGHLLIGLGNLGAPGGALAKVGIMGQKWMGRMTGLATGVRILGAVVANAAIVIGVLGVAMARNRQLANEYRQAVERVADAMEDVRKGAATAGDVYEAFLDQLSQRTGIFDVTLALDEYREMTASLGISTKDLVDLAVNDYDEFERRTSEITDRLKRQINDITGGKTFDAEALAGGRAGDILGLDADEAARLGELVSQLNNFEFVIREVTAASAALRAENQLRARESVLGALGSQGGPSRADIEGTDVPPQLLEDLSKGMLGGRDAYIAALNDILAASAEFGEDFSEEWDSIVADFNESLFDWETAWDGYEKTAALSTTKLTKSIDAFIEDQRRRTATLKFVYDNFGEEMGELFSQLPIDLQLGLSATLAEAGPEKFNEQFTIIQNAWGDMLGLGFENAMTMAPTGARKGLEAWSDFLETEVMTALREADVTEGSEAWVNAVMDGFSEFLSEQTPEVTAALDTLIREGVEEMDENVEVLDIKKITQNMTTAEKIGFFKSMGLSWAEAIALGFSVFPSKVETIASRAAAKIDAAARKGLIIESPSKVAAEWGKQVALGFGMGLDRHMPVPFSNLPRMLFPESPSQPAQTSRDTHIVINNPQHKDDDILEGVKRATALAGLTRAAEVNPGFN